MEPCLFFLELFTRYSVVAIIDLWKCLKSIKIRLALVEIAQKWLKGPLFQKMVKSKLSSIIPYSLHDNYFRNLGPGKLYWSEIPLEFLGNFHTLSTKQRRCWTAYNKTDESILFPWPRVNSNFLSFLPWRPYFNLFHSFSFAQKCICRKSYLF